MLATLARPTLPHSPKVTPVHSVLGTWKNWDSIFPTKPSLRPTEPTFRSHRFQCTSHQETQAVAKVMGG